jgi:UDP-glucose 4-epimerase
MNASQSRRNMSIDGGRMHWLITGGAGFIGSHLVEALIEKGNRVTALDDLSTGSARNLASIRTHSKFRLVVDTVSNVPVVTELVDNADVVVHLAAAVGVKLIVESPVRTIEVNVHGTEVVLNAAAKKGRRVLLASTSEVYGKSQQIPFREDQDLVLGPSTKGRWSYAASKLIDEFLALAYWKERKLPTTVIRLFNTVGPRQTGRYGMVIPTFVRQALSGQPITVFGSGEQSRCFCHVADVIQGIQALAVEDRAIGEVFNLGGTEEIAITGLAERVKRLTDSRSPIQRLSYDEAYEQGFEDMMRRVPDTTKAKRLIGFEPTRKLDEIIRDVVAFESRNES